MFGPREEIPAARWREKLSPPRPLRALDGALYGPPRRPGAPAFLAWIFGHDRDLALESALREARADAAAALYAGGPPGNYLVSGVDAVESAWFVARGFTRAAEHRDLLVDASAARADARVSRADDGDATCAWVAARFGLHWSEEARRAHAGGGLFVVGDAAGPQGFVAAGGNNADAGTFGPVGVIPEARGRGLGEALTRTALHALASQGFASVTVPWVAPERVAFYARLAPVLCEVPRFSLVRRLDG
jgi:GNAT superfamily N-acetyltransferase